MNTCTQYNNTIIQVWILTTHQHS